MDAFCPFLDNSHTPALLFLSIYVKAKAHINITRDPGQGDRTGFPKESCAYSERKCHYPPMAPERVSEWASSGDQRSEANLPAFFPDGR